MKILITSDIHRDLKGLNRVLQKVKEYDYHLDAGDSNLTVEYLNKKNILSVKGNTDFFIKLPIHRIVNINNKKILIVHGHTLNVKLYLNNLYSYAKRLNVDICIYGHTHKQLLEEKDGITFLNPGSVLDGRYVVIEDEEIKLY